MRCGLVIHKIVALVVGVVAVVVVVVGGGGQVCSLSRREDHRINDMAAISKGLCLYPISETNPNHLERTTAAEDQECQTTSKPFQTSQTLTSIAAATAR